MKMEYIREYIVLANTLNFTNAANTLYLTQPALSRHVALIEAEIGTQLFIRTKHYVTLTPMGKLVLNEFEQIIDKYDKLINKVSQLNICLTGELRIAMHHYAVDHYMPTILEQFKEKYPDVHLLLQTIEPREMLQRLQNESVDICLIGNVGSDINSEPIRFHNINREHLLLMVSSKHPLAGMDSIDLSKLQNETFIVTTCDERYTDFTLSTLRKHDISPKRIIVEEHIDVVPFLMSETSGVMIVPNHITNMQRKSVAFIKIKNEDFCLDMALAYKSSNNNPAVPLFIQHSEQLHLSQCR